MTESTTDLVALAKKYRHLVAIAAALVLLVVLLPAPEDRVDVASSTGSIPPASFDASGTPLGAGGVAGDAGTDGTGVAANTPGVTIAGSDSSSSSGGGATNPSGSAGTPGGATAGPATTAPPASGGGDAPLVANCDPNTGRVKIPTIYAAPCVAAYNGSNGGSTAIGVTEDTIKIVFYETPASAATQAALSAAGASNSFADQLATFTAYLEMYEAHYNFSGRKIEVIHKESSGEEGDDAAARADAIDIATRIKPFAVTAPAGGTALNSFSQTLASRGIICICGVSQPQEFYEDQSPFLGYTTLMSSSQGYVHRAEYVCKRLAGRQAVHAGFRNTPADPMDDEDRKFAILYFETEDKAYKAGVDYFEQLLAGCGVSLTTRIEYILDLASLQEQAGTMISRMKDDGITSVIFSGDPISPAIFTTEATNQRWFPEWIVTGSALTDTNLFARTYDQQQWSNAFGISYLAGLFEPQQSDSFKLHEWHYGRGPQANNTHGTLLAVAFPIATGIHLAGPNLNAQTFQDGLFRFPPTGGGATAPLQSYGSHGLWPSIDLTANDDITEIWWDASAVGPDQVGNNGAGMYHYVANGRRYLPGQQPTSAPAAFVNDNAPTFFDSRPASDQGPDYPRPSS